MPAAGFCGTHSQIDGCTGMARLTGRRTNTLLQRTSIKEYEVSKIHTNGGQQIEFTRNLRTGLNRCASVLN